MEPNDAKAAIGVEKVVRTMSQRLIPSTATCQRMPADSIQGVTSWKCQPGVHSMRRSCNEATKVSRKMV